MKKVGIIKRFFALLLVFLLSINGFASVLSDNDGSAFITKAEFDSLKNNFQSQIDSYNQSIDSKIDGAIASYLAGIAIIREENRSLFLSALDEVNCLLLTGNNRIKYKWGMIGVENAHSEYTYLNMQRRKNSYAKRVAIDWETDGEYISKLLLCHLDKTKKIAEWFGYTTDAREDFSFYGGTINSSYSSMAAQLLSTTLATVASYWAEIVDTRFPQNQQFGCNAINYQQSSYMQFGTYYRGHTENFGNVKLQKAIIWSEKAEQRFSLEDEIVGFGNKNAINDDGSDTPIIAKYVTIRVKRMVDALQDTYDTSTMNRITQNDTDWQTIANPDATTTHGNRFIYPGLKWADAYITNWNQIYTTKFGTKLAGSTAPSGSWLYEGLPFLMVRNGEKVQYDISFKESAQTYRVYASLSPFQKTGSSSAKPVKISLNGTSFTDYVDITGPKKIYLNFESINPIRETGDQLLWLKWTEVKGGTIENGGGTFMINGHNTARVTVPE